MVNFVRSVDGKADGFEEVTTTFEDVSSFSVEQTSHIIVRLCPVFGSSNEPHAVPVSNVKGLEQKELLPDWRHTEDQRPYSRHFRGDLI